ncbi:hypothetical protein FHX49_002623 [Microbacterium endophyticum]|uniref:PH domain-containing protein n=1 Tax=Microbacterium endophyticum TaxID=1526412 RepID=A0A7W4V551_9MICO|nr:hypothetical protein [Microbacterium endophyticum]MBB2977031.1 hypothetical protein [Microbacterium endophyticum]NIK36683.1 hypothetical protein [Microbacterium endophyticum]
MTREGALLVMLGVAVALVGLMVWGWLRRTKRDSALTAPFGEAPSGSRLLSTFSGLYVATTVHGDALERLAIRGLGFRAAATFVVFDTGLALDLAGEERIFIPRERIIAANQATVTIDRVVERDGLTRFVWLLADDTTVDSYFRPQDTSSRALAAALESLISPTQISAKTATGDEA